VLFSAKIAVKSAMLHLQSGESKCRLYIIQGQSENNNTGKDSTTMIAESQWTENDNKVPSPSISS